MKRFVTCLLVFMLGFPLSLWSQSAVLPEDQNAKVKTDVQRRGAGESSRVRVTLRNQSEVKGYISQIDAETFQVTDRKSGHVTTIAYHDVTRIRGAGMSTGAKIGIATGIGVAFVIVAFAFVHSRLNHS
jgi:hypothetical protein